MQMFGTIVNAAAVLAGGVMGLLLKGRLTDRLTDSLVKALGLCVCIIGISGAVKGDIMMLVVSMAAGTLLGEIINIDGALNRFGGWVQKKLSRGNSESSIAEGFTTATLLFCVGAMAIVGSIDSGLKNDHSILLAKSLLDGVSAMIFASALGAGVLLSGAAVLVYQGSIVLLAGSLRSFMSEAFITQLSAVGSMMILGIGLNLVLGTKIKAANMLPALLIAAGYYLLFQTTH
jgi:uncharacterized membrane protein YqgA involved in biofilm formation